VVDVDFGEARHCLRVSCRGPPPRCHPGLTPRSTPTAVLAVIRCKGRCGAGFALDKVLESCPEVQRDMAVTRQIQDLPAKTKTKVWGHGMIMSTL
jgi:hypothetical protein